ncbi:TonB-dependent receptor [Lysobacter koreensis]|uniref:TonB-dependent receptor n=1 Tax=Lysobacter koreensis TaxID=266122 RepID=A0ABW2YPY2_9GAMM
MPNPRFPRRLPLALALAIALPLAHAAEPPTDNSHAPTDLDAVEVKATPLPGTAEDLARPVEVLAGERLDAAKASSLGETVSKLPGVQSSYFGPGVGRPIIRGFDGARVQVMSDGLGSGDVSTVSVDHAVSIEPFLASQIEVLKGPATLLYGSGAIGGAVNVIDGRVPEAVTTQPLQGRAELRAGTVNDERTGMMRLDATAAGGQLVFHADALHRETGDYEIPGFAESAAHLAEAGETPDPADKGLLPNSFVRTDSGALGLSWVGERGFLGVASSLFNTRYGVPGHAHEEAHDHGGASEPDDGHAEEAGVSIALDQRRHELRGGLDNVGPFQSLRLKFANTQYTHTEFEGDEVGTVFDNTANEARLEAVHQTFAGWDGAFGVQWSERDFVAIGDEAFVPATRGHDTGLFWLGERTFGPLKVELGARHDRNVIDTDAQALAPQRRTQRKFEAKNLSASLKWDINDAFHVAFGLDRAQRAPTAEELYSNGLHVATSTIEVGDDALDVETANRAELGVHWHTERLKLGVAAYVVRYQDFIYLTALESRSMPGTLLTDGRTPVNLWTQGDARFHGMEAQAQIQLADNASGAWDLRVFGDVVRGELDGRGQRDAALQVFHGDHTHHYDAGIEQGGNLPRIAPARVGGELTWERGPWRASLGAVRYARQDEVAANETPTPGYTLVDAHLAWHRDTPGGNAWEVFLDGSNLLDEEARAHTSFLKDLAPLPGRGLAFGVRAFF